MLPTKSLQNHFDFWLRRRLRWRGPGEVRFDPRDARAASEVQNFLDLFPWNQFLKGYPRLKVADIGAKNFFLAPMLDRFFRGHDVEPTLYGIEIDAFRRYATLHTREAVGHAYAAALPAATFHAEDFLKWSKPIDIALLLNPFVTLEPLVRWGLPKRCFQPRAIFEHVRTILTGPKLLVLSSPTLKEYRIAAEHAEATGFLPTVSARWRADGSSVQKQDRWGQLWALSL